MTQIDLLLATYNGERYIEQQILSLQAQTYKHWQLLIHDDGSTDQTIAVIKKYSKNDNRIILIEDKICYGESASNFMHLLHYTDASYIMFCDQDDIWLDNKVQILYETISELNQDIPQVVYSNSYVWNSSTTEIKGLATLTFPKALSSLLFLNSGIQGASSIFNKKMLNLMKLWEGNCAMHDHVLHLLGLSLGQVTYLKRNLMLYRQHENNVTGRCTTKTLNMKRIINNRHQSVVDKKHYQGVGTFLDIYKQYLSEKTIEIFCVYLKMPSYSFIQKLRMIVLYQFGIYNSSLKLIFKLMVRPYINRV